MLQRLGELPVLLLDVIEQTHILDRDDRLIGKGTKELNLLPGKPSHLGSCYEDCPECVAVFEHGGRQKAVEVHGVGVIAMLIVRVCLDIGNFSNSAGKDRAGRSLMPVRVVWDISFVWPRYTWTTTRVRRQN